MKKYIGILSILIGIFAWIYTFSNLPLEIEWLLNLDVSYVLIAEIIGIAISVFALIKYKEKIISSIGILLNGISLVFVILTFLFLV